MSCSSYVVEVDVTLEIVGEITLSDEVVGHHFGHHARFADRHPGGNWRFSLVSVPIADLLGMYSDPGVQPETPLASWVASGLP